MACGGHDELPGRVLGIASIAGDPEYAAKGARIEWCIPCEAFYILSFIPLLLFMFSLGGLVGPFAGRTRGVFSDFRVERKPYDFCVEDIRSPTLFVTGNCDTTVPPSDTKFTHERLEGSELLIINGAGHLSILNEANMKTIVHKLLSMVESKDNHNAEPGH